jgi:hypothetical protein
MITNDGQGEGKETVFCCAVISSPSALTEHLQIGDILISINEISLIDDCKLSDSVGTPESYFEAITMAMKYSKLPRKLRFLRIIRPNDYFTVQTSSVFELKLDSSEASLLLNKDSSMVISKFDVGKKEISDKFDPAKASLFDISFPLQSFGFRILPYKVMISTSKSTEIQAKPCWNSNTVSRDNLKLSRGDSIFAKGDSLKKGVEAITVTVPNSPIKKLMVDLGRLSPLSVSDDDNDIVSDFNNIKVSEAVSRFEAASGDFIPLSSPPTPVENLDSDATVCTKKSDEVSSMIATIESTATQKPLTISVLRPESVKISPPPKSPDFR